MGRSFQLTPHKCLLKTNKVMTERGGKRRRRRPRMRWENSVKRDMESVGGK